MNARDIVELAYRTLSERGPDAVAEFVDPEATLVAADGARAYRRQQQPDECGQRACGRHRQGAAQPHVRPQHAACDGAERARPYVTS